MKLDYSILTASTTSIQIRKNVEYFNYVQNEYFKNTQNLKNHATHNILLLVKKFKLKY